MSVPRVCRWDYEQGTGNHDVCVIEPPRRDTGEQNAWLHSVTAATLLPKPDVPGDYLLAVATAVKVITGALILMSYHLLPVPVP